MHHSAPVGGLEGVGRAAASSHRGATIEKPQKCVMTSLTPLALEQGGAKCWFKMINFSFGLLSLFFGQISADLRDFWIGLTRLIC